MSAEKGEPKAAASVAATPVGESRVAKEPPKSAHHGVQKKMILLTQ